MLVPNPLMKLHKNSLCICGSGFRFKLCHRPKLPCMVTPDMAAESTTHLRLIARTKSRSIPGQKPKRKMKMARDLSKVTQDASDLYDAGFADGVASVPASPAQGVSAEQEAADIAAAVKPLQDQIAALQADDDAKAALNVTLQGTVDKIKALLA